MPHAAGPDVRGLWHTCPGRRGRWPTRPRRGRAILARNGNLPGRGVFDRSNIQLGSSARRLVIEATYPL